jgi:thiol:disulfide interchange protein DsbD
MRAWLPLALLFWAWPALAGDGFLPPEQAFRPTVRMAGPGTVAVRYDIADGYYLYRDRFGFKAQDATLGQPRIPPGTVHFDDTLEKEVESYRRSVTIFVPVQAAKPFTLSVTAQGCSDKGLCYPPMATPVRLEGGAAAGAGPAQPASESEPGRVAAALAGGDLLVIVPMFLVLGLGLAFTPCVLPMVPIMSSIIVGSRGATTRGRGFALSASYSIGMAVMYTLFGVAAGLAGQGLAATLQNPWVLGSFALLMALFAMSMFGLYQIQMPAAIQNRLAGTSGRLAGGSHAGVLTMGALSALIVGPCVAAPLAGALVYISKTGDALLGGAALFSMAAGMSIPLLLIGASAGRLLPRAGVWMEEIKHFFGVLMLASAWWIVAPFIPGRVQMAGWAVLGIAYAAWLLIRRLAGKLRFAAGMLFGVIGGVQLAGAVAGGNDPFAPFSRHDATAASSFRRVKSVAELDAVLASNQGRAVMLDFYADWCVSCKEMEKFTFSDPRVRASLENMLVLQADVTANDEDDKALLKRFDLFGPPGIIFFNDRGRELPDARVIGYQDAARFLNSLANVVP